MADSPRARNARGTGARLRDEVIAAAIDLLEESPGAGAPTLRAIARGAGVSAPSIYAHFDDLGAITDAVLAHGFDELHTALGRAAASTEDPAERVVAIGLAYVGFSAGHPGLYRFMFAAGGYSPDAVAAYEVLRTAIAECADAGRSASDDPHLDTWMVWAALHGAATLEKPARADLLRLGTLDRPRLLAEMVRRIARLA